MPTVTTEYISAGGNRHGSAADWSAQSDILAFASDNNVALWQPLNTASQGIFTLLAGHKAKVNAVRFWQPSLNSGDAGIIISGDANGELRLFAKLGVEDSWKTALATKAHEGSINCISVLNSSQTLVTGGSDATVKVWEREDEKSLRPVATIATKPRFIPLCLTLGRFHTDDSLDAAFLAAGGTRNDIVIYSLQDLSAEPKVNLAATLKGHEGWIRSLALCTQANGDQLLASASADKYVRIWKFRTSDAQSQQPSVDSTEVALHQNTLTAKVQKVAVSSAEYCITFESLLLGHEDWVYSAEWNPKSEIKKLLTASADGTLTIWEPDESSGIWVSASRLGEISGQKGATTATGSSGGFFNALWSPDGRAVTCLGRTGSWRLWQFEDASQYWVQQNAVSGHGASVNGLAWSPDGSYLLSTSSDQTTRLHAEWRRGTKRSWHEFARPQIHGYDVNCITSTSNSQFISGADEKLLRVFDEPKLIARMLQKLSQIEASSEANLPDTAAIPVLGLSNKVLDEPNGTQDTEADTEMPLPALDSSIEDITSPPTEDILARHTLWPEREKLYGHGYEISEATASESNGSLLATACKASSLDHAVIRLYDTRTWNEIKPSLTAHTLTVTRLIWSLPPHNYLLSVGRDRQWAVFAPSPDDPQGKQYHLIQSNPKAHARMILDAAFSLVSNYPFFVTGSRDKTVKIWILQNARFVNVHSIARASAVTAVAMTGVGNEGLVHLAVGEESGDICVLELSCKEKQGRSASEVKGEGEVEVEILKVHELKDVSAEVPLSRAVNRLAFRRCPDRYARDGEGVVLAVAGGDGSVRVLRIDLKS